MLHNAARSQCLPKGDVRYTNRCTNRCTNRRTNRCTNRCTNRRTNRCTTRCNNRFAARLPEAMFVQFRPADTTAAWAANKLGEWVGPAEIVNGGTKHLHGVTEEGLRVTSHDGHRMQVAALDAAVANFGELTAYPSPVNTTGDTRSSGSSFVLWDNLWGTNYVMWWPFVVPPPPAYAASSRYFPTRSNSDMLSRFSIRISAPTHDL